MTYDTYFVVMTNVNDSDQKSIGGGGEILSVQRPEQWKAERASGSGFDWGGAGIRF